MVWLERRIDARDGFHVAAPTMYVVTTRIAAAESGSRMSDDAWFRDFYESALPVVYGYFLRRCGGRVDVAEELTQETFMSAVKALRRDADIEAPLPWVVSIARRRLVDHYRAERRRRDHARAVHVEASRPLPDLSHLTTTVAEARLVAALDRVPPAQRAALVLRYVDDLPVREVGSLLDRSERAAESLLSRGRRSLRRAYEEADDGHD